MPRSRAENREYMREYRARKRAERAKPLRLVPPMIEAPAGRELALDLVTAELAEFPSAPKSLRAAALAMARVLDDRTAVPQQAPAAGRLQAIMAEVRTSKPAAVSGLAGLRAARGASA